MIYPCEQDKREVEGRWVMDEGSESIEEGWLGGTAWSDKVENGIEGFFGVIV
jgi:hypothetical protein